MKKSILIILITATSFCFGFAVKAIITPQTKNTSKMKKVTGIGGIFFKCKDPKKVTEWYQKHLGLTTNPYGATFDWYEAPDSTKKAQTQWTPFAETTKYFEPSTKDFMINYRVENLVELVEQLKKEGVTIVDKIETYDYGKFVHILDAEGNKVQLWEPID
jgi:predicted enzyme related to lactoylglutathione lyase